MVVGALKAAGYKVICLQRTNGRGDGLLVAVLRSDWSVEDCQQLLFHDCGDRVAQLVRLRQKGGKGRKKGKGKGKGQGKGKGSGAREGEGERGGAGGAAPDNGAPSGASVRGERGGEERPSGERSEWEGQMDQWQG